MIKIKGLILFLVILGLSGCATDDIGSDFHFVTLNITEAELPESFQLNTPYNIRINYQAPDGCTAFDGLNISPEGDFIRNIEAIGTTFNDAVCADAIVEGNTTFEFEAKKRGTYVFRFYSQPGMVENGESSDSSGASFIEYAIPVTN